MQRVRMKTHITGTRDGVEWPEIGGELELPDHEAADLAAQGYAELIGPSEAADQDAGGETPKGTPAPKAKATSTPSKRRQRR